MLRTACYKHHSAMATRRPPDSNEDDLSKPDMLNKEILKISSMISLNFLKGAGFSNCERSRKSLIVLAVLLGSACCFAHPFVEVREP